MISYGTTVMVVREREREVKRIDSSTAQEDQYKQGRPTKNLNIYATELIKCCWFGFDGFVMSLTS